MAPSLHSRSMRFGSKESGVRLGFGHGSAGRAGQISGSSGRAGGPRVSVFQAQATAPALAAFAAGGLDRLGVMFSRRGRTFSIPSASRFPPVVAEAASSMSMAHMPPSAGLGSEFKWDISTAQSRAVSLSKLAPRPLKQYLSHFDVVALAAALLLGLADVAVVHRASALRPIERGARCRRSRRTRSRCRSGAGRTAWRMPRARPSAASRAAPRTASVVFSGIGSVSWSLNGRGYNVSRSLPVGLEPHDGVHLQAARDPRRAVP